MDISLHTYLEHQIKVVSSLAAKAFKSSNESFDFAMTDDQMESLADTAKELVNAVLLTNDITTVESKEIEKRGRWVDK